MRGPPLHFYEFAFLRLSRLRERMCLSLARVSWLKPNGHRLERGEYRIRNLGSDLAATGLSSRLHFSSIFDNRAITMALEAVCNNEDYKATAPRKKKTRTSVITTTVFHYYFDSTFGPNTNWLACLAN